MRVHVPEGAPPRMHRRRIAMADGRPLIFYSFDDDARPEPTQPGGKQARDV